MLHAYRVLHHNFNLLIKTFSLSGVTIILPFFRSPSLTLWLNVPRGCNKEGQLSVELFWSSQYYYNFNRIKILKNPKIVIRKNIFTICLGVITEDKSGVKRIRLPNMNMIKDESDKYLIKYVEKPKMQGELEKFPLTDCINC
jgi:hypothetical protein